jgi:hypothetical protein
MAKGFFRGLRGERHPEEAEHLTAQQEDATAVLIEIRDLLIEIREDTRATRDGMKREGLIS